MRKLSFLTLALILPALVVAVVPAPGSTAEAAPAMMASPAGSGGSGLDGKQIFLDQKCDLCHTVSSAGIEAKVKSGKMAGPDLKGVAAQKSAEWITKWLHKEEELDGRKHPKMFTGNDEQLKALISWLQEQK